VVAGCDAICDVDDDVTDTSQNMSY